MVSLMVGFSVLIVTADAETSTFSPPAATRRVTSTPTVALPLTTTSLMSCVVIPLAVTDTLYRPDLRPNTSQSPAPLVLVCREVLVSTSVTVTFALVMTAPDASFTVPRIVPKSVPCPNINWVAPRTASRVRNNETLFTDFIVIPREIAVSFYRRAFYHTERQK